MENRNLKNLVAITLLFIFASCQKETPFFKVNIKADPIEGGLTKPMSSSYELGQTLNLIAEPNKNYRFKNWTGDFNGNEPQATISVSKDLSITGVFEKYFDVKVYANQTVKKTNTIPIFAHYMPWFESPEYAKYPNQQMGNWGMHWTMNNKNPTVITNGKREIASYYYPLIGPYDNGEPHYLEYVVSIMKLAGIDGVIIDMPGITEVYDYDLLLDHTNALIPYLDKAGLKFAICYEDNLLKVGLSQGKFKSMIDEGKRVMTYFNQNYFSKENYFKINNIPVLLNFGPQSLKSDEEWNYVFSPLKDVLFFPLSFHAQYFNLKSSVDGAFAWVSESGDPSNTFYDYAKKYSYQIGGAIPGYKDFYKEGGWGNNNKEYDSKNLTLFNETLNAAYSKKVSAIQLITWNDYGEGTIIEPTEEFKYKYLTEIQKFTGVTYGQNELSIPVKMYLKRKEHKGKIFENQVLDQVFNLLISLQTDEAQRLIDSI